MTQYATGDRASLAGGHLALVLHTCKAGLSLGTMSGLVGLAALSLMNSAMKLTRLTMWSSKGVGNPPGPSLGAGRRPAPGCSVSQEVPPLTMVPHGAT